MGTLPIQDEVLLEAVELRNQHATLKAAADAAGVAWSTFQNRLMRAAERGLDGSVPKALPLGQRVKGISTLYKQNPVTGEWDERLQWVKTKDDPSLQTFTDAIREAFESYKGAAKPVAA